MATVGGIIVVCVGVGMYFLPWIVAGAKNKRNANSIGVINFFFGWTFIGWVVALAMAVGQDPQQQQVIVVQSKS